MNPNELKMLYSMDIECRKVVKEWNVHPDIAVCSIAPSNKFAPMTWEQTIVGISNNALFHVDPQMHGNKLVDAQCKQYITKTKFSGVTTTGKGMIAVASSKGDIRLFDSASKNAKAALTPLGDPIISIDVTVDG